MAASGHPRQPVPSAIEFLIASKRSEIAGLEHFRRMSTLVANISSLVHALQRERGASNLYLGSGGHRHRDRLEAMAADSDEHLQAFNKALTQLDFERAGDGRLFSRLAMAVHLLSELRVLRARVSKGLFTPEEAIRDYSELLRSLIAVVFEAADTAMDPALSRTLVALFNFMQGKEFAGQERATGSAGFAAGSFDPSLAGRMQYLAGAQQRCFEVFAEFAEPDQLGEWQAVTAGEAGSELENLRGFARTDTILRRHPRLEERWFDLTTARIDAMKAVEDRLQSRLQALCEERLGEAREALAAHRSLMDSLLHRDGAKEGSFLVLYEDKAGNGNPVGFQSGGLGPRLGRSLVDLVQSQSHRLQAMNDELIAAKTALEERRLLDRAKALLMKHRNLREEEAYQLLRKTAMDQSRSITDVARAMISVAEVWSRGK
ncbi:ANTAR domain-containing protein [Proteobacteria bacterium 005FR1]|nr:ANTAR domain-containing protein [Proteobacteria bacterium 005FR1]